MQFFAEPLAKLIDELRRLPGIGAKTGQRLAFHILSMPQGDVKRLAEALMDARERIRVARMYAQLTDGDVHRLLRPWPRQVMHLRGGTA